MDYTRGDDNVDKIVLGRQLPSTSDRAQGSELVPSFEGELPGPRATSGSKDQLRLLQRPTHVRLAFRVVDGELPLARGLEPEGRQPPLGTHCIVLT